jgi:hypothetical protein
MEQIDWLSRLLDIIPVSGRAEHRRFLAGPWLLSNVAVHLKFPVLMLYYQKYPVCFIFRFGLTRLILPPW